MARGVRRVRRVWRTRLARWMRSAVAHAGAGLRRPVEADDAQLRVDALRADCALPVHALRGGAHARIGEALDAGTGARRVGIVVRQGATVAAGAVVREQPAVTVGHTGTGCIGHALTLLGRPVEAADA